ncbi:MAG: O-antigen ligase family protein [Thermodesulfovibrionales bacterium]
MGSLRRINPEALLWYGYAGLFFSVPLATSPTVICGAFVLLVWLLSGRFLKDISGWTHSGMMVPVGLLIVLPWVGLIYTPVPEDGFPIALKTHYWLYAFALSGLLTVRRNADFLLRMFIAGLSLNSAVSILQYVGIVPLKKGVATGLLGGSSAWIAFSLLLTTGILVASFYFFKSGSKKERALYACLMLLYFFVLGFTGGRSGYIALIVLSPVIAYNIVGQRHRVKILVISILAVSFLFTSPVVRSRFEKAKEDISQYQQGNVNTSLGLRYYMWKIALSEIKSHPFLGVGTAGFKKSWEVYKKDDPSFPPSMFHPHNSFLYMQVSYGIFGLVSFCWLLFIMVKKGWKNRESAMGFASFAFTAVFILGSLTDTEVIVFATAVALPLFTGISAAIDGPADKDCSNE